MVKDKKVYPPHVIRRSDRGLCVAGTGKTLYTIMDFIKAEWPKKLIQDWMELTDEQISCVMEYIKTYRKEFEAEYDSVVKDAEEDRKYWEKLNQERIEKNRKMGPPPGKEELWNFVQSWKAELGMI
jgi:hypothetical protein